MSDKWFEVDREGLYKLLRRKGFQFVLYELIQNCWDTNATRVNVTLTPIDGRPLVEVIVEDDDPEGFVDITHAYTLYAESTKKGDPEKRGRFNLGEKLVLAACKEASIATVKGTVTFNEDGERSTSRKGTKAGSKFIGLLRITRDELWEMEKATKKLIPPIPTFINGEELGGVGDPIATVEDTLPTEVADEEGFLRRSARKTEIRVYEPAIGESGGIYEMGIPVVETDDPWIIDIRQKVPLNADRDNVTPAYHRAVRVIVVNALAKKLTPEQVTTAAVRDALEDERISPEAVTSILDKQFGKDRVVFDPSDPEATARAAAEGYTVIPGRTFSTTQWENIRNKGKTESAGKLFHTPKPYENGTRPEKLLDPKDWTDGMKNLVEYVDDLSFRLIGRSVTVRLALEPHAPWRANYGCGGLCFNVSRLGRNWFERGVTDDVNALIIHELAHDKVSNHLSEDYYRECCRLGAKLARQVLEDPEFFKLRGMD
jgi:hypothetical protein